MKKRIIYIPLLILFSLTLTGCPPSHNTVENKDILFQYSALGSLLAGVFDGDITFGKLKKQGDFGLGTFNALDGEMIAVDHQFYQIKADGIAYQVPDEMKAPFAVVTWFGADQTIISDTPMNWDQLLTYLDSVLPTENIPFAIKIEGTFDYMKTRSVPRQNQPYPRLLEVLKTQPVFEFHQVEGVMAGFRLPDYVQGLNAPGYHFHFITKNRDAGGHVLDCKIQNIKIEIDYTDQWHLVFPEDEEFYHFNMTADKYQ